MRRSIFGMLSVCFVISICAACGGTSGGHMPGAVKVDGRAETSNAVIQPKGMPPVILVEEFGLEVADVRTDQGLLGGGRPARPGILKRDGGLLQRREDPAEKARRFVDLLASSLTEHLQQKSLPARRLIPGERLPDNGWLIRGQFYEVDEGNRLRRAVIGFGVGATDMELGVTVIDRSLSPDAPFLVFGTQAESGKMPGAIVTMNPYVAAAKFVMAKNASEKDVKHTAGQIATEIVNYMKTHEMMNP
ncbi:MAG: DUF4410 domain-containing protein [Syntrophobacteraceae bacterium]|nr:DUF4410 domain-containing protein [Desulfobacteraceae bacterium]